MITCIVDIKWPDLQHKPKSNKVIFLQLSYIQFPF